MHIHLPNFIRTAQDFQKRGFALISTILVMSFLMLIALAMLSVSSVETRSSGVNKHAIEAQANARMALMLALGELQQAAGPDQRITANADIFTGDPSNAPQPGRNHWLGVWDTSDYDPSTPDGQQFVKWLVSSSQDLTSASSAKSASLAQDHRIFEVMNGGVVDQTNSVSVDLIPVNDLNGQQTGSYSYWVEDEGVKADLEWNEGEFTDANRKQAARLSASPGVDHGVFGSDTASPLNGKVSYPLSRYNSSNDWLEQGSDGTSKIDKLASLSHLPHLVNSTKHSRDWLKLNRKDITFGNRAVICDVKNGGLRRDLSLAFEMDGAAESENAVHFNKQLGEFVGGSDGLSASQNVPGTTLIDRYLFRDFPTAGNPFSGDITISETFVRGPSWSLMRDYATLYKRMRTSAGNFALDARAYYPNRGQTQDLFDIHAQKNGGIPPNNMVLGINRETSISGVYSYRPVRANYAPVLLGVNAIYSLAYKGGQLELVVDPFFIIWNPYDVAITAPAFAVTLENGFIGGFRFRITDADGKITEHGKPSVKWKTTGTDTSFTDYAKNRNGGNANLSYLLKDLSIEAGEVLVYSSPRESDRSANANVTNDELIPGMNYGAVSSGIFFDQFPDNKGTNWKPIPLNPADPVNRVPNIDPDKLSDCKIEIMFNVLSQNSYAINNYIETSLPSATADPDELNTEANYGSSIQGKEVRINLGGSRHAKNIDRGKRGYSHSYTFDELGASKKPFGISSILVMSTDHNANSNYGDFSNMEVFSQLNATATLSTNGEVFYYCPMNTAISIVPGDGINTLMDEIGVDLSAYGSGKNGFYGKSYSLSEGDSKFPLISIPNTPMHSLVQLSGANIGTRLLEPTHAIGNSWIPPYIPTGSIYNNTAALQLDRVAASQTTSDTSWLINDALFDRYYFSGIAPTYTIGVSGYRAGTISTTLETYYKSDYTTAQANPVIETYSLPGKTTSEIISDLDPNDAKYLTDQYTGYKKIAAYSMLKGAFNINSTSVNAWRALLRSNKKLAVVSLQGTTGNALGTPFPMSSSASDANTTNGWEKFSRLSDSDIDTLATQIVNEVKTRGPFMSISDFVNRRISTDATSHQGAIQAAIESAGINDAIRVNTSAAKPNYDTWKGRFPFATAAYTGNRNNATGIPIEINQANILLPIAPKITARSDTFTIRAYGESVRNGVVVATAYCEAKVQRFPEYMDTSDDAWKENYANPLATDNIPANAQLSEVNQTYGRRFKIIGFQWLNSNEL